MGVKRRLLHHRVVQLLAILYLLLFIASQLVTPTTASFHDTETIVGSLSVAESFDEEQQEESNNTDPEKNNSPTKDEVEVSDHKGDDSDSQHSSGTSNNKEKDHVASDSHSDQADEEESGTE